jgi:hypothetical protein
MRLDDPGRVRSQIINVVCQIQRFDFDRNLVSDAKINNPNTAGFRFKTSIEVLNVKVGAKKAIILLL